MITDHADTYDGERVLWAGRPARFRVFDFVGVLLTGVSIYCVAGAVFSIVSGVRHGKAGTVIVASVITGCVLAVVIGRPLLRRAALRATRYLLTESRIVVYSTRPGRRPTVAYLSDLSPATLSIRDSASIGTIEFEGSTVMLVEIENARQVHQLVISAQVDA